MQVLEEISGWLDSDAAALPDTAQQETQATEKHEAGTTTATVVAVARGRFIANRPGAPACCPS